MVLDEANKLTADAADTLAELLNGSHPWQKQLPQVSSAKHSFVIGANALTLDYARFLPALTGLRFNFDGKQWQPELRVDPKALPENYDLKGKLAALWRSMPSDGALCAALPVHWQVAKDPLKELLKDDTGLQTTLDALGPLAAICWYADSRLSAPLFVTIADRPLPTEAAKLIANLAEKSWSVAGVLENKGRAQRYVATVPSRHGLRHAGSKERSFEPALAMQGNLLVFSPDQRQVDAVLSVASKRAAALGDLAGVQGPTWLVYSPKRLAQLVRSEVQEVLPADEESFFREVARNRLWPRLDAWGKTQQAAALVANTSSSDGFVSLDAKPLGARGNAAQ
jgi:uncharacterized protein YfaA (DUF2138 family)